MHDAQPAARCKSNSHRIDRSKNCWRRESAMRSACPAGLVPSGARFGARNRSRFGAFRPGVSQIQNPILREGSLGAQSPDLRVAVLVKRIDATAIGDRADARETVLEGQHLRAGGDQIFRSREGRLVRKIFLRQRIVNRHVVENRIAAANHGFGLNPARQPGEADARCPISVIAVDQRARVRAMERSHVPGVTTSTAVAVEFRSRFAIWLYLSTAGVATS